MSHKCDQNSPTSYTPHAPKCHTSVIRTVPPASLPMHTNVTHKCDQNSPTSYTPHAHKCRLWNINRPPLPMHRHSPHSPLLSLLNSRIITGTAIERTRRKCCVLHTFLTLFFISEFCCSMFFPLISAQNFLHISYFPMLNACHALWSLHSVALSAACDVAQLWCCSILCWFMHSVVVVVVVVVVSRRYTKVINLH
jgi:hypothetical protein